LAWSAQRGRRAVARTKGRSESVKIFRAERDQLLSLTAALGSMYPSNGDVFARPLSAPIGRDSPAEREQAVWIESEGVLDVSSRDRDGPIHRRQLEQPMLGPARQQAE
jgi:hypothetical protein